jgi:hypothetical protein
MAVLFSQQLRGNAWPPGLAPRCKAVIQHLVEVKLYEADFKVDF